MHSNIYTTSERAWEAMYEAIGKAKRSIYIEMYIFVDDMKEHFDIFKTLIEKAKNGVGVVLVLDGFGSRELSKSTLTEFRNCGIEVLFFKRLFRRIHRKVVIIDEGKIFLGGVNMHGAVRRWFDLEIELEGIVVKQALSSFAKSYEACGGKNPKILAYRRKRKIKEVGTWFIEHSPFAGLYHLRKIYEESVGGAQHRIVFVTPYFIPHRWLRKLIEKALSRDVRVEILMPEKSDHLLIDIASYWYAKKLASIGVHFYLLKEMNHAKALLVDDRAGLIGSQNIDALSFDFNSEASIYFDDVSMVQNLKEIIADWQKDVKEGIVDRKLPWYAGIVSFILKLFQPVL